MRRLGVSSRLMPARGADATQMVAQRSRAGRAFRRQDCLDQGPEGDSERPVDHSGLSPSNQTGWNQIIRAGSPRSSPPVGEARSVTTWLGPVSYTHLTLP